MKRLSLLAALATLWAGEAFSQSSSFVVPILFRNGSALYVTELGVHTQSTIGVDRDTLLGPFLESLAPPLPPEYVLDARFRTIPNRIGTYPIGLGSGTFKDIRAFVDSAQVDSFQVQLRSDGPDAGLVKRITYIQWPSDLARYGHAWEIRPLGGSQFSPTNMLAESFVEIPADPVGNAVNVLIVKSGAKPSSAPVASSSRLVTGTGVVPFNVAYNLPHVSVSVSALNGTGFLQSNRYADAPANVSFTGAAPAGGLAPYRWTFRSVGILNLSGSIAFDQRGFPSNVSDPSKVTVYWRSTEGSGAFAPLATTVADGVVNAAFSQLGEFVFGLANTTSAEESSERPSTFALEQNYPNPFNPSTTIRFSLDRASSVRLEVYDLLGRRVSSLLDEVRPVGQHQVSWNATGLSSGLYLIRLQADARLAMRTAVLVR